MKIKIYGERNTGTNVLKTLLSRNTKAELLPGEAIEINPDFNKEVNIRLAQAGARQGLPHTLLREALADRLFEQNLQLSLGWKHASPPLDLLSGQNQLLVIFLVKNPYAWLVSLALRPYHGFLWGNMDLTQFMDFPWITLKRELCPACFENPVSLWNHKMHSYLEAASVVRNSGNKTLFIRFEDLVENQEAATLPVRELTGDAGKEFIWAETATKEQDRQAGRNYQYYREYYRTGAWKKYYTAQALEKVSTHLDTQLLAQFGYDTLPEP